MASFYPISTVTSAKIATGEEKIAFPQRLPANAPSRACGSVRTNASRRVFVYTCVYASTLSSVENYVFSLGNVEVDSKNRELASTATI